MQNSSTAFLSTQTRRSIASAAVAFGVLLPLSSAPAADFVGFVGEGVTVSTAGGDRYVIDVYAEFVQSSVNVVNLYDANISNTNGTAFHHSDLNTIQSLAGTWSPGSSISVGGADPTVDSFVTVGGDPGSSNTTTLDPAFSPATASVPPTNSGWYNSSPLNGNGVADPSTNRVLVGRFVTATPGDTLDFTAWITFADFVGGVNGTAQQVQGSVSIPYSIAACDTLVATAASTSIAAAGTSSGIAVSVEVADASCEWSASSDVAWLTLSAGSGTGNGSSTFTVAENTGSTSRAATITISSGTASDLSIIVTQAGVFDCGFAASPLQREISFIGSLYGSSWSFDVAADASCAWTATPASGSSWLTVTSGASGTGTGRVTYTVAANFFLPTRTGTIEIRNGGELVATHTVVQAQPAAECSGAVDFDSSSISIAADARTHSVDVTTNGVTCAWYASSADSWITVDNGGSFTGDGSVTFTVAANSSVSARSGTISIGSGASLRTLSIEQSGVCGGLAASPTQRSIAFLGSIYGESYGFDLLDAGGTGCSWSLVVDAGSPAWLNVTSATSGSGAASVAYTADINLYAAQRTGTISVVVSGTTIATHTVVQAGPAVECTDPVLFEPSSRVVAAAGESFDVAVSTSGATCAWYAESSDAWITITNGDAFTGDGTMSVTVAENTGSGSRSGSITVGSGAALATFAISQAGTGGESCDVLAASATSTSVPASGTTAPIAVTVTTGGGSCGWSASSNQSWLTLSGASGTGASGSFTYSASENTSTSTRSATITVISGLASPVQIEITQEAASISCASVFAQATVPGSTSVDAAGTSGPVQIDVTTGGATCTWSASSDSAWLALASASGTGASGSFTFVASENLSASSRVGTITVSSGTATPVEVVVTQQGYSNCASAETVDPMTASVTADAGSGTVAITTPTGTCAWQATVTSGSEWLSITSGGSGVGSGSLAYSYTENTASSARVGVITLAGGGTFTLTQAGTGTPCELWTPADIGNSLVGWWDAGDLSTLFDQVDGGTTPNNGEPIARWADKGIHGQHVVQSSAAHRPTLAEGAVNGRSAIRFTSDCLELSTLNLPQALTACTMIAVIQHQLNGATISNGVNIKIGSAAAATLSTGHTVQRYSTGGRREPFNSFQYVPSDQSVSTTSATIQIGSFDWGNADLRQYINGTLDTVRPGGFQTAGTLSSASKSLLIGAFSSSGTNRLDGLYCEIILISDRLDLGTRHTAEGYLAHRWGIQSLLPDTHPYKDAAPTTGSCQSPLSIYPNSTLVSASGTNQPITVRVESNGVDWTVNTSHTWLMPSVPDGGSEHDSFELHAQPNPGIEDRVATVHVAAASGQQATFDVTQQAACELAEFADCNSNGVADLCEALQNPSLDSNHNLMPDLCELAAGDLNLDGRVDGADLAVLLSHWGDSGITNGDLDDSGQTDGADLALLLSRWSSQP